jgi:hypothetical protein
VLLIGGNFFSLSVALVFSFVPHDDDNNNNNNELGRKKLFRYFIMRLNEIFYVIVSMVNKYLFTYDFTQERKRERDEKIHDSFSERKLY